MNSCTDVAVDFGVYHLAKLVDKILPAAASILHCTSKMIPFFLIQRGVVGESYLSRSQLF